MAYSAAADSHRPMSVALIAAIVLVSLTQQIVLGEQYVDPRSYLWSQVWFGATPKAAFPRQLRQSGTKQPMKRLRPLLTIVVMYEEILLLLGVKGLEAATAAGQRA